jgi:membrane protein required for colicin V production
MHIDLIVISILCLFIFSGYKKGIIVEFVSFGALAFNIIMARKLSPFVLNILKINIQHNKVLDISAYIITFIIMYVFLNLFTTFILKTLKRNTNMTLDSIIGALFGFLKGIIVIVMLMTTVLIWGSFDKSIETQLKESRTYFITLKAVDKTKLILPDNIREIIDEYSDKKEIDEILEEFLKKEMT